MVRLLVGSMSRTTIRIVVPCLAGVALLAGAGVLSYVARSRPFQATEEQKQEAIRAASAFYEHVRETSRIELPEAGQWRCAERPNRRGRSGRPVLSLRAELSGAANDGRDDCTSAGGAYDLASHEIVRFSVGGGTTARNGTWLAGLDQPTRGDFVRMASDFAERVGDVEYQVDYSEIDHDWHALNVVFDRVMDDVHYIGDRVEVRIAPNGFVSSYFKRREIAHLPEVTSRPETELLDRARTLARREKRPGWEFVEPIEKTESLMVAAHPRKRTWPFRRPWLWGYLRPTAMFASSWRMKAVHETGVERVALIRVFLSPRTGRLIKRDNVVVEEYEVPYYVKILF